MWALRRIWPDLRRRRSNWRPMRGSRRYQDFLSVSMQMMCTSSRVGNIRRFKCSSTTDRLLRRADNLGGEGFQIGEGAAGGDARLFQKRRVEHKGTAIHERMISGFVGFSGASR